MFTNPLTQVFAQTKKLIKKRWTEKTQPGELVSAQAMSDEVFLAQFDLAEVSTWLAQGNIEMAKKALLSHYAQRISPAWPAFPNKITDLGIDLYQLSRQELVALADSILGYHFLRGLGRELRITPTGTIDWGFNPGSDSEWLWLLNRQPWWPILAWAYAQTGDERYATEFVSQMLDWIKVNPPPLSKDEKSPAWRLMEVGLRLRISWIPSFALLYTSPALTDEAKLKMLRSIYDHARFLFLFTSTRNHLLRESNGLAFASIYFPEFKEAKLWQQTALTRLDTELIGQINQDGSHIEVSTGYQWLVIDEFQHTYDLLCANNLSLPQVNLASWLEKMYSVPAYLVRPDGTFPQINDGFIFYQADQLVGAGERLRRDDLVYIGTHGSRGTIPEATSTSFEDAGLFIMRSDWGRDARYLLFDAGPYGGPHGHEDKLSIELFAFGQSFIVDPGSYTYNKLDPFRTYFVGSEGHNTVLIDNQSQVRRWQKDNLNPKPASGNYAIWRSQPDFDYVAATYNGGYSHYQLQQPKDATITNVTHTRHILFIKPEYWIIVDELQADTSHHYQALFHTPPEITAKVLAENKVVLETAANTAKLYLIPVEPDNVKVSLLRGSETPIQGWYSADSGHKTPATVVIYEGENSASTIITTLLYPCKGELASEQLNIKSLPVSGGKGLAFLVTRPHGRDYLLLGKEEGLKHFGPYQSSGLVAGVRTDREGNLLTQFEGKF